MSSVALHDVMNRALTAQKSGDLIAAESQYREALQMAPDEPDCLHMLGVIRMQRFAIDEALQLIRRAGDLTSWHTSAIRHNYGHLLSVFLSGREHPDLPARIAALHAVRSANADASRAANTYAVLIVAAGNLREGLDETLDSLNALSEPPVEVAVLGAKAFHLKGEYRFGVSMTGWNTRAVPDALSAALAGVGARYVLVLHAADVAHRSLPDAVSTLRASGAKWGCSRTALKMWRTGAIPKDVVDNGFQLLKNASRAGATLFADAAALKPIGNLIWERDFLCDELVRQPESIRGLVEQCLWSDEPVFIDHVSHLHRLSSPDSSEFWNMDSGSSDAYLALALSDARPPNPVAPCQYVDGASFLKRALRLGLGARCSSDTLKRIATVIEADVVEPIDLASDGIELVGFVRAEIGLGESLRLLAHACGSVQLPFALTNIVLDMGVRQSEFSLDAHLVSRPTYRTRVICTNPDSLGESIFIDGAGKLPDAYDIGYWYWELENFPPAWTDAGSLIDELWVATDFVRNAAAKVLDLPITKITPPILQPTLSRTYSRGDFDLPESCFLFLFSFDFGSFPARKNPEATIRAFKQAFPPSARDVRLVLKCQRAHTFPAARQALLDAIAGDERIILFDKTLTRDALVGLQSLIDCYVSLHRSEGLGLGMAECMALGKPVIGTAYSGNLEFMNEKNSLLVDYHLVSVKEGEYLETRNQVWAEPNVTHAAGHMRRVYEDRRFAETIAACARDSIRSGFSLERVGNQIRDRLTAINGMLRQPISRAQRGPSQQYLAE